MSEVVLQKRNAERQAHLSAKERQAKILELLQQRGSVRVAELRELFQVSDVTVREDLAALEAKYLLVRQYGGAVANERLTPRLILTFAQRATEHAEEKQRIGRAAATLVHDGETIIFDAGTTVMEAARHLRADLQLTIMTHALNIAIELGRLSQSTIVITGGTLEASGLYLSGPQVVEAFQHVHADRLFLGITAIDLEKGLTEASLDIAFSKRAMIQAAREVIVLADASKFGSVAFARVCPLSVVQKVITDANLDPEMAEAIRRMGVELVLV